jgi:Tfp pilus assembly protein PilV
MEFPTQPSSGSGESRDAAEPTVSAPLSRGQSQRNRFRRGFTLVEAMVASGVFCMCTLGVYAMLIQSYKLSALSRTRDDARAVIRTFADQFERLQTTNEVGNVAYTRWLFHPDGVTGKGMVWGALSDSDDVTTPIPNPVAYLSVNLGTSSNMVPATITRSVDYVSDTTGATAAQQIKAAGYMMVGTFTITFSVNAKTYTESLTMVRAVP